MSFRLTSYDYLQLLLMKLGWKELVRRCALDGISVVLLEISSRRGGRRTFNTKLPRSHVFHDSLDTDMRQVPRREGGVLGCVYWHT